MKVWKKFSAVALALMMVTVLTVMASATTHANVLTSGGVESNDDKSSVGTTIDIPKAITVHGTPDSVYSPTVTYTYTIAQATVAANTTVTDSANGRAPVRQGPSDGVSLTDSTAVFTSTLTAKDTNVSDTITVSVDPTKFDTSNYGPGVYRYAITGSNDTEVGAAGVTANGAATRDDRFLDVYIKNASPSGLEVYGFVLLTANESVNSETTKSNGFTTDNYHTIDVQLTKSVTGGAANKTHQFPFNITVNNTSNDLGYFYKKGTDTLTSSKTTALATTSSTTLANGETFYIQGLNPLATVTYVETNDTVDTYKVTINDGATPTASVINSVNATDTAPNATQTTGALTVSNYTTSVSTTAPTASANASVTFINSLEAISPTGVALRYAPYLAMMGAGVVALPLTLRKKEEEI